MGAFIVRIGVLSLDGSRVHNRFDSKCTSVFNAKVLWDTIPLTSHMMKHYKILDPIKIRYTFFRNTLI